MASSAVPLAITSGSDPEEKVVVDALPYFDLDYQAPGVREAAMALVEEETRRYRPTRNYLDYLPPPKLDAFMTEVMKNEFDRVASRVPMKALSMKRYELPSPAGGKLTDITSWNEAVNNSYAQLEHQALRLANLELLSEYGASIWQHHNNSLVKMVEQAQRDLQDIRKQIQEINWQRKNEQTDAGDKLKKLEEQWVMLVSKNYEIERACVDMEKQLSNKS